MTEREMIKVKSIDNTEQEYPLADLDAILAEHRTEYPMALSNGQALVFAAAPSTSTKAINRRHHQFLKDYFLEAFAQAQIIMEKDAADRTADEDAFMMEFNARAWPYQTEHIHSMLVKPKMTLGQFREMVDALPTIDWDAMVLHCAGINMKKIPDPPN